MLFQNFCVGFLNRQLFDHYMHLFSAFESFYSNSNSDSDSDSDSESVFLPSFCRNDSRLLLRFLSDFQSTQPNIIARSMLKLAVDYQLMDLDSDAPQDSTYTVDELGLLPDLAIILPEKTKSILIKKAGLQKVSKPPFSCAWNRVQLYSKRRL